MIKTKKQMYTLIGAFALIMLLGTVTYAFFNYTRTGVANNIRTGRIYFNAQQGDTVTLSDLFPISLEASEEVTSQTPGVGSLTLHVTGDTTYDEGIEYLVKAVDVTNTSGNASLPISIAIKYEANGQGKTIGEEDEDYYTNRGGDTSLYKVLSTDSITNDGDLVVGYIAKGQTGIDGNITIMAYLDAKNIAITDTYNETSPETDLNGTTTEWINGRSVFTTEEWNNLQASGVSFKVKVEANEGIWVDEVRSVNVMNTLPSTISNQSSNIKEVYFNKMSIENMQSAYEDATIKADLTYNDEGKVLAWLEPDVTDNSKYILYIVSDGNTYLTTGERLFAYFYDLEKIEFNNVDTSRIITMKEMFKSCEKIDNVDLTMFNTTNVNSMMYLFKNCYELSNINMNGLDFQNVESMLGMFQNCSALERMDMSQFSTPSVTNMFQLFYGCTSLQEVNLSGLGSDNLSNVTYMFYDSHVHKIDMSGFNFGVSNDFSHTFSDNEYIEEIDLSNAKMNSVTSTSNMFGNCSNVVTVDLSGIDMSSVQTTSYMFLNSSKLETIYVSNDWSINPQMSIDMFSGCTSLVGGNGTTYTANNPTDKTYAIIDGGQSNPGYLTLKTN